MSLRVFQPLYALARWLPGFSPACETPTSAWDARTRKVCQYSFQQVPQGGFGFRETEVEAKLQQPLGDGLLAL